MMSFPYQRLVSRLVLLSFFFQTLWPSVVFAATDVEVYPSSASAFSMPSAVAVAPFTLQAFVDDQAEGFDTIGSKPVVLFPGAASLAEAQAWFDGSLAAQSLYPDLVLTEQGLLWSQYDLNFLMATTGHLYVSSGREMAPTTKMLRIHNYHGDVIFGNGVSVSHLQVQAQNILQASPDALIERLEIWAMGNGSDEGRFTNKDQSTLTTTQVTVHEGHLENLGTWTVSDQGVVDLQGHDFINQQTLTLGDKAVVKNQETFGNAGVVTGSSYTLEMVTGENAGVISGDAPCVKVLESLTNQPDAKIVGESSLVVSGQGTIDNQGTVTSEKTLALENKTFINQGLVHSKGTMRLAVQESLINKAAGSFLALDQTTIAGKAIIHNEASVEEHAGIAFGGGVHFEDFQGEVINDGLISSQTTMSGVLRKLVNTGIFGVNQGYQGLTILDFLNEATGKILGDGHLILTGRNRGLMQTDRLVVQVEGVFVHETTGLLQAKTALETSGGGKLLQQGQVHTPLLTLNTARLETVRELGHNPIEVVIGRDVSGWRHGEGAHWKVAQLTLEAGAEASGLAAFTNEGTLNIGTFTNRRSGFTNRDQMVLRQWHQAGSFKNEMGGFVEVEDKTVFEGGEIENEGDLTFKGDVKGDQILSFINKGAVRLEQESTLRGRKFVNHRNIKALKALRNVFDVWSNLGDVIVEGDLTGKVGTFETTKNLVVKGLMRFRGGTLSHKGVLKVQNLVYFGEEIIGEDQSEVVIPGNILIETTKALELKGKWRNGQGVTLKAAEIYNRGQFTVRTGKAVLEGYLMNHGHLDVDELVYDDEFLINQANGKLEANTYHRKTPFKMLLNSADASFIIRKGGFTAQRLINQGALELADGLYQVGEEWDNKDGKANIDQLCLAFLNPVLEGNLDATVLVPFEKPYESLTIAGETVFRKGEFKTKKLTTKSTLKLQDGSYTVDHLEMEAGSQVALLEKAQLELLGIIDNRGEITSPTSIEVMSREDTPDALVKAAVTNPRLLLNAFWRKSKSSWAGWGDIRKLGKISVVDNLSVLFGTEKYIAYFLSENVSNWAIGKTLFLKGDQYKCGWRLDFPWPTEITVDDFYHDIGTLKIKDLKLDAKTFKLGDGSKKDERSFSTTTRPVYDPANGKWGAEYFYEENYPAYVLPANQNFMGTLEIYGSLNATVEGDVDCRYGIIKTQGSAKVVSIKGDILLGDSVVEKRTIVWPYGSQPSYDYTFNHRNGARFTAGGEATFESKKGKLLFTYGSVYTKKALNLRAQEEILNLAGAIWAGGYIQVETPFYQQKADALQTCPFVEWQPVQRQNYHYTVIHWGSDAPELHSLSSIFLRTPKVENIGGTILAINSLFNENYDEDISFIKNHAQAEEILICGYERPKIIRGGIARGGQEVKLKADVMELTGSLNAPKLKIDVTKLLAKNLGSKRGDVPQVSIIIDLYEVARHMGGSCPLILDAMSQGRGLDLDVLRGANPALPAIQDQAAVIQGQGALMVPRSLSSFDRLAPLVLTDDLLRHTVVFALSNYLGTLNVYGMSGDELLGWLLKNSKAKEKALNKEGQLITTDTLKSFDEGMIYHELMRLAGHDYRVPKLLVATDMVNPHGNESGAITGVDVDIHVKESMSCEGNTIHAAAIRRAKSQQLAEKKATERQQGMATVFEEDEEKVDGDDSPALRLAPSLKIRQDGGTMALSAVHLKSDGDARIKVGDETQAGSLDATALNVSAKSDVSLEVSQDIALKAMVRRAGNSENYQDSIDQSVLRAEGGNLAIKSGRHTVFHAIKTYSKLGTSFDAGGHLVDQTVALMSQRFTRDGKNWTRDTSTIQVRSEHVSEGVITSMAQGVQDLTAPQYKAQKVVVFGGQGVVAREAHNRHDHASHREKKGRGWFGRSSSSDFQSSCLTSVGMSVEAAEAHFISGGDITLTNPHFAVDKTVLTALDGVVQILQGTNYYSSFFCGKSADMFWQSMTARSVQSQTYTDPEFSGTIEIQATETIVQQVCGRTLAFMDKLDVQKGKLTIEFVRELYDVKEQSVSGPTAALSAVIALAASIAAVATGGAALVGNALASSAGLTTTATVAGVTTTSLTTAGGIVAAMGSAGFSALCAQSAMAIVMNKGNLGRAAQQLAGKDSIKALLMAMATAGAIAGVGQAFGLPVAAADAKGLMGHVQRQALHQGVGAVMAIASGESAEDALKHAAVSGAAGVAGGVGANHIGDAYAKHMVDAVTHKVLHMAMAAGIGAVSGALLDEDAGKSALAAAIGAGAAETVHDIIKEDSKAVAGRVREKAAAQGIDLKDQARIKPLILEEIRARLELSKLGGAVTALLAGQDVGVAAAAATNAIENNAAAHAVLVIGRALAGGGVGVLFTEGVDQETQKLKEQLGIGGKKSAMDAAPEDAGFEDEGMAVEEGKPTIYSTPMPEDGKAEPLATPAPDYQSTDQGFAPYDGPSAMVWDKGKHEAKPKTFNQIDQEIRRGQAPRGIERIDRGQFKGEQTHIHFGNGAALNIDGSWKEGEAALTREQKGWLVSNGWKLPSE